MTIIADLQANPALYMAAIGILGLVVGSFLNVVIHRLPQAMFSEWREQCCELLEIEQSGDHEKTVTLSRPRSRCPHCGHRLRAIENIPVFSYLFLKGRCASCSQRISPRYPVIEVASSIVAVIVAWKFGVSLQALLALLLSWSLICLTMIDFDHQLLPDDITLPLLWIGIIANMSGLFTDIHSSLIGAIAGYLSFWSIYMIFKLATGKEGMGHGDFKLLAMLGAWLGWQLLPLIIILSSVVGAIVGITLLLFTRHERSQPIPFGPYIAIAGWIALICGVEITNWYILWSSPA